MILSHGKVRGCGSFEVTSQSPINWSIDVECDTGSKKTANKVRYWPAFSVNGREVAESAWDETWLSTAYCVKKSDGTWDQAFINLSDAHDRARQISSESGQKTLFYAADSLLYWETRQNDRGEWSTGAPTDEVKDRNERQGCGLEKSVLDYEHQ
nr:hypothetical protein [uncultured Devosia sp.]